MPKHESQHTANGLNNEQLLAGWLEGTLDKGTGLQFEKRCLEDDSFASQVETANFFAAGAELFQGEEVPSWDAEKTFLGPQKSPWWTWQGLPALSLATSFLAIVMLLTGLQIQTRDGALTISFSDQHSSQEVERLVAVKLSEFKLAQQLAMNNYSQGIQQQQIDASGRLTEYLLGASRKERREDFAELIKHVNEQRTDDQLFYARQVSKLQQDIFANPFEGGLSPTNQ
jgi:hypothetical protein